MTGKHSQTWETVWVPLLEEAAQRASSQPGDSNPPFGQYAAAIILAKASWETFHNEFIEARELSEEIKGKQLTKAIPMICAELNIKAFNFSQGTPWEQLLTVSRLRNALVHHDAKPRVVGEAPNDLVKTLCRYGVVESTNSKVPWERLLVTSRIAGWSCTVVGRAILELESIPNRRRRNYALVQQKVLRALEPILPKS